MVSTEELFEKSKNSDQPVIIVCPDKIQWDIIIDKIKKVFKTRPENIIQYAAGEGVKILRSKASDLIARPLNLSNKFLFILSADGLSREEANTLLKVLEEPPDFSRIFLFCTSLARVIPTIRSRCKKIVVGSTDVVAPESIVKLFFKGDFSIYLRKLKDIDSGEIPAILEAVLRELKVLGLEGPKQKLYKKIGEAYLLASGTNSSRKLIMEELFIWWKAQGK